MFIPNLTRRHSTPPRFEDESSPTGSVKRIPSDRRLDRTKSFRDTARKVIKRANSWFKFNKEDSDSDDEETYFRPQYLRHHDAVSATSVRSLTSQIDLTEKSRSRSKSASLRAEKSSSVVFPNEEEEKKPKSTAPTVTFIENMDISNMKQPARLKSFEDLKSRCWNGPSLTEKFR